MKTFTFTEIKHMTAAELNKIIPDLSEYSCQILINNLSDFYFEDEIIAEHDLTHLLHEVNADEYWYEDLAYWHMKIPGGWVFSY